MLTRIDLMILQISAGELGIEAEKLEKQLSVIFQIANQWDAILLLDEADVFLERRSSQNLHRNGLVSVFLRKLEYCTRILFLTTNRVSEFAGSIRDATSERNFGPEQLRTRVFPNTHSS